MKESITQGEMVKNTREKANLTQEQFAEALGVSVWTVRAWEQNKRNVPKTTERLISMINFKNVVGISPAKTFKK